MTIRARLKYHGLNVKQAGSISQLEKNKTGLSVFAGFQKVFQNILFVV